ncbi:leucyl aminopeptidase [Paraburkholderia humisilvae]|uniref:Crocagin biosynthetic protein CgnE/B domain-containing protein n=1 Tax=Paraburkholderia humisilvae TaxID=627669 RepID=A0A6J5EBY1_9BURK|nr:leucyl aminopeptidase [Paraburkholderia humisilvae]CAB3763124.1 hypothetical protein LMG29542_04507 [Paraburkholderia humisilvae]
MTSIVQNASVAHFAYYLSHHPAVLGKANCTVMLGYTSGYEDIATEIEDGTRSLPGYQLRRFELDHAPQEVLSNAIREADVFVFFYDSSTLPRPQPGGPGFVRQLQSTMTEHWRKSILFKDYGPYFREAFSVEPERIDALNSQLIGIAAGATHLAFSNGKGSWLNAPLHSAKKWTSINGKGNFDLVPGEIATHCDDINACLQFTGTFLSTIPFAVKYGVISSPVTIVVEKSRIVRVACESEGLRRDLEAYLSAHPSNSTIEELGIGTNEGVRSLYGRNAGFEERHCGLHLGLGGGAVGSHHLDLIFSSGTLQFDERIVFDGQYRL